MLLKLLKKLLGYYDDGDLSYICDYCENFIWFDKKINENCTKIIKDIYF